MLSVLNVSQNYYIRGGSDRYYFSVAELLEARGHQVIPFTANHPKNQPTDWSAYFPDAVNFDSPTPADIIRFLYSRPAAEALQRLLSDHRPDIAHLHIYYGQLTSSILAPLRRAKIPVVQTLHEYKIVCPVYTLLSNGQICQACEGHNFWQVAARRCNQGSLARSVLSAAESYVSTLLGAVDKVDHFIAVSDFLRNKVIELGVPAHKVTTVHNFTDLSGISPCGEVGEYFLYFGRLERLKGIFTLLKAMQSVRTPLLIVGDGKARAEVEEYVQQHDLKHVRILGHQREQALTDLIRGAICTISPSEWYETFGLTLIESFAHGRPVIASRIGGMTEVVCDGTDGFLIEPGNVEALQDRLQWMADHRDQAVKMGQAGRRKVEMQFSAEAHYHRLMDVYSKVM
ncbi:MAG: glycosyltransferase family 4 protein [Gemmatimonadaceae bacterium]|nr:glycosyltransferase family 4 protein [Gloeobacterales cyanobacterium ES-bin-141]